MPPPSPHPPPFAAVLLAAGRSTRMGRDKALLDAGGRPLWERQRDVLLEAGAAPLYLSARPDQAWAWRAPGFAAVLQDQVDGCGPLVGVTAALERAEQAHVAALAIDLPRLPAAWLQELAAQLAPGVGGVGRRDGFFEPLAAIYPREFRYSAWEAIARGEFSLQRLLAAAAAAGTMRVREIPAGESAWFENWNGPARATSA